MDGNCWLSPKRNTPSTLRTARAIATTIARAIYATATAIATATATATATAAATAIARYTSESDEVGTFVDKFDSLVKFDDQFLDTVKDVLELLRKNAKSDLPRSSFNFYNYWDGYNF